MAGANPSCAAKEDKRKLIAEGGRAQKSFFDIGQSDEKKCEGCHKAEGTEKHRLYHVMEGSQQPDPKRIGDVGANERK